MKEITSVLLMAFPFSVLFCPPIRFGIFYARIDELILFVYSIFFLLNVGEPVKIILRTHARRIFFPFILVFVLFCWGVLWGDSISLLSSDKIRELFRPIYLAIVVWATRRMLLASKVSARIFLLSVVLAISSAGILGVYAMKNADLSLRLVRTYSPYLEDVHLFEHRFNMSVRAMSVFYGYDQAAITYAIGSIIVLTMMMKRWRNRGYFLLLGIALIVLFSSILSSARVGFVALTASVIALLVLPSHISYQKKAIIIIGAICIVMLMPSASLLFPDNQTMNRFSDLIRPFIGDSSTRFYERSEGMSAIIDTQVRGLDYPGGLDAILGYGDNLNFVSDVGYVSIYIKYGLLGLLVVAFVLYRWYSMGRVIYKFQLRNQKDSYASLYVLECLVVLFAVAAFKGPLYFLTIKSGDIVAMILGVCLYEFLDKQSEKRGKLLGYRTSDCKMS